MTLRVPRLIRIDDLADPRLEPFRDIKERDLVGRRGLFVAEGDVVVRTLLSSASRHEARALLLAPGKAARLADALAGAAADLPVYEASDAVLQAVAGFDLHRGVLAIGCRAPDLDLGVLLAGAGAPALVVAAFGLSNHDNLGGLFRNAAAFGAAAVLLDPTSCDPLYRKAIRVSTGAALRLPFVRYPSEAAALDALAAAGFTLLALTPGGRTRLRDLEPPTRAAAVFGAEGSGLSPQVLARCRTVAIPMPAGFDSLNVATTSGIVLHHLREGGLNAVSAPARPGS